jgi:catalase
MEPVRARLRSPSFADYYTQPRFFWLSLTEPEKKHLAAAFAFELSKVARCYIRERVVDLLTRIDTGLARSVAEALGLSLTEDQLKREVPGPVKGLHSDPALSLYATGEQVLKGRRVALLCSDGVCEHSVQAMRQALSEHGVHCALLAPHMGCVKTKQGGWLKVNGTIAGEPSVLFDAVAVPEGTRSLETLSQNGRTRHYLWEAFRHLKPIALPGEASAMVLASGLPETGDLGLILEKETPAAMARFLAAMKQHRIWCREDKTCGMPKVGK